MNRLSISLILAVLASVFTTGWLADRLFSQWAESPQAPEHALQTRGYLLSQLIEQELLDEEQLQAISGPFASNSISIKDNGSEFERSVAPYQEEIELTRLEEFAMPEVLRESLLTGEPLLLESDTRLHWYYPIKDSNTILSVSHLSLPDKSHTMRLVFTTVFYLAVAGLILAWVFPLTRQLRGLGIAAEAIGQGDLSLRVPTRPASRLRVIELQFNRMAERLQLLVEDNKLLCSAVSHDLRTPLARLRFGIDTLSETLNEKNVNDAAVQSQVPVFMERLSDDLTRMEQLVSALLDFAKLDQSLQNTPRVPVNINDAIAACCNSNQGGTRIQFDNRLVDETAYVSGNADFMLMLVNNVVDNALRFAQSKVLITLSNNDKRLQLRVEDDGKGFDLSKLEQLKKPFERGECSATITTESNGYGLGLALVDRLAKWMQADLIISKSETLKGASVLIDMDRCQPP